MKQGLFWEMPDISKNGKTKPPDPVWLASDYLPGLEAAKAFNVPLMSDDEILKAAANKEELVCDIEIYGNYFLCAFMSMETGKSAFVEMIGEAPMSESDLQKLNWILGNFKIITFNGINFDLPILSLAVKKRGCRELKHACDMIIQQEIKPNQVLKSLKCELLKIDHIDLIQVAPLAGSLKIYGGRLHVPKMQDLPFPPEIDLSPDQISIMRFYCINDLTTTAFLNANLKDQIAIRVSMSAKYGIDLRSKSDAQIAEAVIKNEIKNLTGVEPKRPSIPEGTSFRYTAPSFVKFEMPVLKDLLQKVLCGDFVISEKGSVITPATLRDGDKPLHVKVGKMSYKVGIGGLHSTEEVTSHKVTPDFKLADRDVASYYPMVILNQQLYPKHLGTHFLQVYETLVKTRLAAKRRAQEISVEIESLKKLFKMNKAEIEQKIKDLEKERHQCSVLADSKKIEINGSFGKLGSKWSFLYAPDLMIQVTVTGQLALLMLIERLELAGVEVVSANTDGIVFKHPRIMQDVIDQVVAQWEEDTSFETEETEYSALYSRDVNNYIAVKPNGKTKTKGAYSNPWNDPYAAIFRFHKNPTNSICVEAVTEYLTKGIPISDTINACRDLAKFLTVRAVKGGAVKDGIFLGKAIRWYYSKNAGGIIIYAKSGNKVPKSDDARPCMEMPDSFPIDLDFDRYEMESSEILKDIGAI